MLGVYTKGTDEMKTEISGHDSNHYVQCELKSADTYSFLAPVMVRIKGEIEGEKQSKILQKNLYRFD